MQPLLPPARFSPRQNKIIANTTTLLCIAVFTCVVGYSLHLLLRLVSTHANVLLPPVVAIIFAKVFQPLFDAFRSAFIKTLGARLSTRAAHRCANGFAAILLSLILFVPLTLFLWYFGKLLIEQLLELLNAMPQFVSWIRSMSSQKIPKILELIQNNHLENVFSALNPLQFLDIGKITHSLTASATTLWGSLRGSLATFTSWIVLPVYTLIFLASRPLEGSDFTRLLVGVSEKTREHIKFLIDEFIRLVVVFFRGQVLVALIQGVLFGLGFQWLVGVPYGMLLGLTLGILNIVPYLGNIVGLPIIGCLALFSASGSFAKLCGVLAIFIAVQTLDAYFITPRIIGNRTGLNAFVVIFSLFFWSSVIGGALGMVLAIPLSAFIAVFWKLLVREYLSKPPA